MPARRRTSTPASNAAEDIRDLAGEQQRHAADLDDIADHLDDMEEAIKRGQDASEERYEKLRDQIQGPRGLSERMISLEAAMKAHMESSKLQHDAITKALEAIAKATANDPNRYTLAMDKTTAATVAGLVITVLSALGYGVAVAPASSVQHPPAPVHHQTAPVIPTPRPQTEERQP